ncbi:MAG: hypothetical protein WC289_05835 [Patescibacteria group bacterium]|jgi:hypothetical protein
MDTSATIQTNVESPVIRSSSVADDTIAGEHIGSYFRMALPAAVLLVIVDIVLYRIDQPAWMIRTAEGVAFILGAWWVMRKRSDIKGIALAGCAAGLFAGIGIALYDMIIDPHFWRVFNFIARPMWMVAFGGVTAGMTAAVLRRLPMSTKSKHMKGGDHHG